MEAVEWYAFNDGNSRHKFCIAIFHVSSVTNSERIVDREVQSVDVGSDYRFISFYGSIYLGMGAIP